MEILNCKWAYKFLTNPTEELLNELGNDGWELVGITSDVWVMKKMVLDEQKQKETQNSYGNEPISKLFVEIHRIDMELQNKRNINFPRGFSVKVSNACKAEGITTIDMLLSFGSRRFKNLRNIGNSCISYISEALRNLYGIEAW